MDIIRQEDVLEALRQGPISNITELAERFADKDSMTCWEWMRLKNNLNKKLTALSRAGLVRKTGLNERLRWEIVEEEE